jgi:hypothetical protein
MSMKIKNGKKPLDTPISRRKAIKRIAAVFGGAIVGATGLGKAAAQRGVPPIVPPYYSFYTSLYNSIGYLSFPRYDSSYLSISYNSYSYQSYGSYSSHGNY